MPTRFGIIYAGLLLLILLGSINYNNSLGHLLCFLLASMGWVGMHHSYRNLAKINLIKVSGEPTFLGQKVTFKLQLDNPTQTTSYQIELASRRLPISSKNPFKYFKAYLYPSVSEQLESNSHSFIPYTMPSIKRGRCVLGRVRIASQFPLGLFTTWSYFPTTVTAIIYPEAKGELPLPILSSEGSLTQQNNVSGDDDFSALTNYRAGDPLKSIAWKALARDNVLRTKQFNGFQGGDLMLSWQSLSQLANSEERLSQLCQWVIDAEKAGIQYGLTLPNKAIPSGSGKQHQQRCLTALALYNND